MKKFLSLVLFLMVGLAFTLPTLATDSLVIDGKTYGLSSYYIEYEFYQNTDRLNFSPVLSVYQSDPYITYIDTPIATQLFDDYVVELQTLTPNTTYTYQVEIEIDVDVDYINDDFSHLVVKYDETYFHYFNIPDDTSSFIFTYDIDVAILNDGSNYVDSIQGNDFAFDSDVYDMGISRWSSLEIYLVDLYPSHDQYVGGKWIGALPSTVNPYTENYLFNYFTEYVAPYSNDQTDLEDLFDEYFLFWKNDGLTLTLPTNYQLNLYNRVWDQAGINEWYEIYDSVTTLNIRLPDLSYDGTLDFDDKVNYGLSELWGTYVTFTVDGTDSYSFFFDETEGTFAPLIGFYIYTTSKTITYITNGGTSIASQFVAQGGHPLPLLSNPTRTGWVFLGWTLNPLTPSSQDWNSTNTYEYNVTHYVANENMTFYAIWKKLTLYINLEPNGGLRLNYPNFNANVITTSYGDTAEHNHIGLDLDQAYFKLGYSFGGWYQDTGLTIPFNEITPLTSGITIYAKWITGTVGESSPSALNNFLDQYGLLNFPTLFFFYVIIIFAFVMLGLKFGFPTMVYVIFNILVTALWFFFGWFNGIATIIILLTTTLMLVWVVKER